MAVAKTDLAWLAGIIDGEGSIGVGYSKARRSYQTQLQIENTNKALMDKVIKICLSLSVKPKLVTNTKNYEKNPKWKLSYRYCITKHSELETVLVAIEPYLVAKKRQAHVLLKWVKLRQSLGRSPRGHLLPHTNESQVMYLHLKELNK